MQINKLYVLFIKLVQVVYEKTAYENTNFVLNYKLKIKPIQTGTKKQKHPHHQKAPETGPYFHIFFSKIKGQNFLLLKLITNKNKTQYNAIIIILYMKNLTGLIKNIKFIYLFF